MLPRATAVFYRVLMVGGHPRHAKCLASRTLAASHSCLRPPPTWLVSSSSSNATRGTPHLRDGARSDNLLPLVVAWVEFLSCVVSLFIMNLCQLFATVGFLIRRRAVYKSGWLDKQPEDRENPIARVIENAMRAGRRDGSATPARESVKPCAHRSVAAKCSLLPLDRARRTATRPPRRPRAAAAAARITPSTAARGGWMEVASADGPRPSRSL